jgi:hypothetical protein
MAEIFHGQEIHAPTDRGTMRANYTEAGNALWNAVYGDSGTQDRPPDLSRVTDVRNRNDNTDRASVAADFAKNGLTAKTADWFTARFNELAKQPGATQESIKKGMFAVGIQFGDLVDKKYPHSPYRIGVHVGTNGDTSDYFVFSLKGGRYREEKVGTFTGTKSIPI